MDDSAVGDLAMLATHAQVILLETPTGNHRMKLERRALSLIRGCGHEVVWAGVLAILVLDNDVWNYPLLLYCRYLMLVSMASCVQTVFEQVNVK